MGLSTNQFSVTRGD